MGIKGVKTYLKNNIPDNKGVKKVSLSKYRGKKIALDFTNFLYKFLLISDSPDHYLLEFINIIHKFSKYGIDILFIFDGKPIEEKKKTIDRRKNVRNVAKEQYEQLLKNNLKTDNESINGEDSGDTNIISNEESIESIESIERFERVESIESIKLQLSKLRKKSVSPKFEHIKNCQELFNLMGIEWYHIKNTDADIIFKYLFDIEKIDACYSADMDILLYECPILLQDLDFHNDEIYEYNYAKILHYLNITNTQLLNACVASGTDYNFPLKHSKIKDNIELIKKYNTIENIIQNLEIINADREYKIEVQKDFDYKFAIKMYKISISDEVTFEIDNKILFYKKEKLKTNSISRLYIVPKLELIIKKINKIYAPVKFIYKIQEFCNYKYGFTYN